MADSEEREVAILSRLQPSKGAVRNKRRKGRGPASGLGKTCGHGQKGQKSRSGTRSFIGFEGGQMPLQRRLPKIGFHNLFSKKIETVNVASLNRLEPGSVVDANTLIKARLIGKQYDGIKILGEGELKIPLTVQAHAFSASAKQKIEQAGGTAEVIEKSEKSQEKAVQ